jgi:hypothetical protein
MIPQRGSAGRGRLSYIAEATTNQNTPCSTRLRKVKERQNSVGVRGAEPALASRLGGPPPRFCGMSYHVCLAVVSSTLSKSVYFSGVVRLYSRIKSTIIGLGLWKLSSWSGLIPARLSEAYIVVW